MFLLLVIIVTMTCGAADYWKEREKFLQDERSLALGGNIKLTQTEEEVNNILMKYKKQEIDAGFKNPAGYPLAMHFFDAKKHIEKSLVYAILKQMPKGALLHAHDISMMPPTWIVKNATYRDNLYACKKSDKWNFIFTDKPPGGDWKTLNEIRKNTCNVELFDKQLESLFTLEVANPETHYKDINAVWDAFMNAFITLTPIITYKPVFEEYFYEVLQRLYNDNIQYLEFRGTLPDLYELDGSIISGTDSVAIMEKVNEKFLQDHSDHKGMKFIFAPLRKVNNNTMESFIQQYKLIKQKHPEFVVGFDLVGQEDLGNPLCDFITELKSCDKDTKFFFHAGETDWYGLPSDKNLIDAVLLNTTRIGHGYAIAKHPKVLEEIKKRGIAVEINPISNQVLLLVKDIRNHPGTVLISQGCPVVISSDDPGFWGASMLSHDFYFAFMGLASYDDDLRFLKQLIINSLTYNVLPEPEKENLISLWRVKWDLFLNNILTQYNSKPNLNKNSVV